MGCLDEKRPSIFERGEIRNVLNEDGGHADNSHRPANERLDTAVERATGAHFRHRVRGAAGAINDRSVLRLELVEREPGDHEE